MKTIFNTRVMALTIAALSAIFASSAPSAHGMPAAEAIKGQAGTAGMMLQTPVTTTSSH